MTSEEFQKAVLEEFNALKSDINAIKSTMATKEDVHKIVAEQQKDVIAMLQLLDKKLSDIQEDMKSITEIVGEHEVKIRTLIRRPV